MDKQLAHPHQEGGGGYLHSHIYNHNLPYGLKNKSLGDIYYFSLGGMKARRHIVEFMLSYHRVTVQTEILYQRLLYSETES